MKLTTTIKLHPQLWQKAIRKKKKKTLQTAKILPHRYSSQLDLEKKKKKSDHKNSDTYNLNT